MIGKAVILDLDDVLVDYTNGFLAFVAGKIGRRYKAIDEAKSELSRPEYFALKTEYRNSGIKRDLTILDIRIPMALLLLRSAGFEIAIVSSRPVEDYPRVKRDTIIWLAENGVPYDRLLFSRQKDLVVLRQYAGWKTYVIEDDRWYAEKFLTIDCEVFLVDKKGRCLGFEKFRIVDSCLTALEQIIVDEEVRESMEELNK